MFFTAFNLILQRVNKYAHHSYSLTTKLSADDIDNLDVRVGSFLRRCAGSDEFQKRFKKKGEGAEGSEAPVAMTIFFLN